MIEFVDDLPNTRLNYKAAGLELRKRPMQWARVGEVRHRSQGSNARESLGPDFEVTIRTVDGAMWMYARYRGGEA